MTSPDDQFEELSELSAAVREDRCTPEQASQLNARLIDDPSACDIYARYVLLEAMLEFELGAGRHPAEPSPRFHTPIFSLFSATYHGTVSFFSQEIPFALLMATVVTSLGLLVGSMIYVTHHQQLAEDISASPSAWPAGKADMEFVGRVTGMVDVRWSDIDTSTERGNGVPLGRKYAMASGLMEITYDTGAKVILQGPATYEVDSRDGGFLSVGKLTARLEKKRSGVRGQGSEKVVSGQWPVASEANPKSQISNPQSPTSIFAVRTPTATVTDLGTEFGVEVDKNGVASVHVFQGIVEGCPIARGSVVPRKVLLHANEAARFQHGNGEIISTEAISSNLFARAMPQTVPAGLIAYEGFVEAKGHSGDDQRLLAGLCDGTGWRGGWYCPNFSFRTNDLSFAVYPATVSFRPDPGLFENRGGPGRAERFLATPISLAQDGEYYLSFCAQVFGDAGLSLAIGNGETNVAVGWNDKRIIFVDGDLGRDANPSVRQPASSIKIGSLPQFYVMRIVISAGSGKVYVKVFDPKRDLVPDSPQLLDGKGEGNNQWTLIASGRTKLLIDRLILRSDGNWGQIDGIRIGTTWESVTGCRPR